MENKLSKACGFILVSKSKPRKFLLLHQVTGNWSFPKGHTEGDENEKETALRELKEETGITEVNFLPLPPIVEEYDFPKDGETWHKINTLFFAETDEVEIEMQVKEILEYKWVTFEESLETFFYQSQKKRMPSINNYITTFDNLKNLGDFNPLNLIKDRNYIESYKYNARGIVVLPNGNTVIINEGERMKGHTLPGGQIEVNEKIEDAFVREIKEETGYDVTNIKPLGYLTLVRDNYLFISYGFYGYAVGDQSEINLTEEEKRWNPIAVEVSFTEAQKILETESNSNPRATTARAFLEEFEKIKGI